jgi:glycerophosphoryl diester phosphodiesterase
MPAQLNRIPGLVCPAIVAHRGASMRNPENTLIAFDAAIKAGADMIELDVRLTADGIPVVLHDADVATTTDGSGLVHELTLTQVRELRAGADPGVLASVPTLHEALSFLRGRTAVEIDIKNDPGEPGFDGNRQIAAGEVLKLLNELDLRSVLVSSANPETVQWVKWHAPETATGVEIEDCEDVWKWLDYSTTLGHAFLLPSAEAVLSTGKDFAERAHALGVQIDAWTVDDPAMISKLFAWGVDTVETNDPELAVPIRDRARSYRANAEATGTTQ